MMTMQGHHGCSKLVKQTSWEHRVVELPEQAPVLGMRWGILRDVKR